MAQIYFEDLTAVLIMSEDIPRARPCGCGRGSRPGSISSSRGACMRWSSVNERGTAAGQKKDDISLVVEEDLESRWAVLFQGRHMRSAHGADTRQGL